MYNNIILYRTINMILNYYWLLFVTDTLYNVDEKLV